MSTFAKRGMSSSSLHDEVFLDSNPAQHYRDLLAQAQSYGLSSAEIASLPALQDFRSQEKSKVSDLAAISSV